MTEEDYHNLLTEKEIKELDKYYLFLEFEHDEENAKQRMQNALEHNENKHFKVRRDLMNLAKKGAIKIQPNKLEKAFKIWDKQKSSKEFKEMVMLWKKSLKK